MKKLLGLLAAFSITTTSVATVISCGTTSEYLQTEKDYLLNSLKYIFKDYDIFYENKSKKQNFILENFKYDGQKFVYSDEVRKQEEFKDFIKDKKGQKMSIDEYASVSTGNVDSPEVIAKIKYGIDYIAENFNILPEINNDEYFYDFSELNLSRDVSDISLKLLIDEEQEESGIYYKYDETVNINGKDFIVNNDSFTKSDHNNSLGLDEFKEVIEKALNLKKEFEVKINEKSLEIRSEEITKANKATNENIFKTLFSNNFISEQNGILKLNKSLKFKNENSLIKNIQFIVKEDLGDIIPEDVRDLGNVQSLDKAKEKIENILKDKNLLDKVDLNIKEENKIIVTPNDKFKDELQGEVEFTYKILPVTPEEPESTEDNILLNNTKGREV